MDNDSKRKVMLWGQVLFLVETMVYILIAIVYMLNKENILNEYITFTEAMILGILGGVFFIFIPFLILKCKFIINFIISLRVIIFIYTIIFFNNIILIIFIEVLIFIYSIIYIYAYLTLKKR